MNQDTQKSRLSRRQFVQTAATAAAVSAAFPRFVVGAAGDSEIKVGLVGCGGRGTGAAVDAMNADPHVKIVALADIYQDRLEGCRNHIKKDKGAEVADGRCFLGFDAYQKLLDTDIDYAIFATPPYYRPDHLTAAVKAGKHVFMEKPVAVDPVGIRKVIEAGKVAKDKNLSIVAGTQRRHEQGYLETIKRLHDGAIGDIVSAQCYWNGGQLWYKTRQEGWSESEWMHRDWVNWSWLSGDHVVEQHVHNLDVITWVLGKHPVKVLAMGGRARRVTGNQFDFFSADFEFPNHVHVHSMCRQVSGCGGNVSERVIGQKGVSNCNGWISAIGDGIGKGGTNPYVQEHKDLIASIRDQKGLNEAQNVAHSTLCAIMIRQSAYTGKEVTWDEMMASDLQLGPPGYDLTPENIKADIPIPGTA